MENSTHGHRQDLTPSSAMIEEKWLKTKIKELIVRALRLTVTAAEIPDEAPLFETGLGVDSTATLEIVFALEAELGIEISDDELRVELFDSVASLTGFVAAKLRFGAETI